MVLGTAQQGCKKEASRKNTLLGTAASRIDQKVTLRLRSGRNIKRSGRLGRLVELTATSDGFATAAFLCHDKKDQIQIIGFCIENLEVESKHTGGFFSVYLLSHRPTWVRHFHLLALLRSPPLPSVAHVKHIKEMRM